MTSLNKQWLLKARPTPDEIIGEEHFELVERDIPEPGENELLVRTLVLGTSPAQRAYTTESRRFHAGVDVGSVMHGRGIGVVEKSNLDGFSPGDVVAGSQGWQQWSIQRLGEAERGSVNVASVQKIETAIRPTSRLLGALGSAGFTALYGMEDIGEISPGKTVLVSAAAGGVGWYDAGKLNPLEDISEGLETMPAALGSLSKGTNKGVKLVRVGDDP